MSFASPEFLAASIAAERLPSLALALDGLLSLRLPPCPMLALGWILGHGAQIAQLPPNLRQAGADASRLLCADRLAALRAAGTGFDWPIDPRQTSSVILARLGLSHGTNAISLEDLAKILADAAIRLNAPTPPTIAAPPILSTNHAAPETFVQLDAIQTHLLQDIPTKLVSANIPLSGNDVADLDAILADFNTAPALTTARLEIRLALANIFTLAKSQNSKAYITYQNARHHARLITQADTATTPLTPETFADALLAHLPHGIQTCWLHHILFLVVPGIHRPIRATTAAQLIDGCCRLWRFAPDQTWLLNLAHTLPWQDVDLPMISVGGGAIARATHETTTLDIRQPDAQTPMPPVEALVHMLEYMHSTQESQTLPSLIAAASTLASTLPTLTPTSVTGLNLETTAHARLHIASDPHRLALSQLLGNQSAVLLRNGQTGLLRINNGTLLLLPLPQDRTT